MADRPAPRQMIQLIKVWTSLPETDLDSEEGMERNPDIESNSHR